MRKKYCEYCDARGYRYEGYGIGTLKCKQCNGEGYIPWPSEWRPAEQVREDDTCMHMKGTIGSCARCEGT